jgi:hypothetical protein
MTPTGLWGAGLAMIAGKGAFPSPFVREETTGQGRSEIWSGNTIQLILFSAGFWEIFSGGSKILRSNFVYEVLKRK